MEVVQHNSYLWLVMFGERCVGVVVEFGAKDFHGVYDVPGDTQCFGKTFGDLKSAVNYVERLYQEHTS